MRRTIADEMEEKGELRALKRTLLRLLRERFDDVPDSILAVIEATKDPKELEEWVVRAPYAKSLKKVGIGGSS